MTSETEPCASAESIQYTLLVRGDLSPGFLEGHPHMVASDVDGDVMLTGVLPERGQFFDLMHQLTGNGIEILSVSAWPPIDPEGTG